MQARNRHGAKVGTIGFRDEIPAGEPGARLEIRHQGRKNWTKMGHIEEPKWGRIAAPKRARTKPLLLICNSNSLVRAHFGAAMRPHFGPAILNHFERFRGPNWGLQLGSSGVYKSPYVSVTVCHPARLVRVTLSLQRSCSIDSIGTNCIVIFLENKTDLKR